MKATPVTVVFDIGKTNKKVFLFDDQYQIVWEKSEMFEEISDDDGYPCDDIHRIGSFVKNELADHLKRHEFEIIGVNFTTYGASLVFINADGNPVAPIYNYLKPFPESVKRRFYDTYGGETYFSYVTASPVLGSLNSGLMLYRIMHEKPTIFNAAEYALHLPQYVSSLITGKRYSELTSIGCHTGLWNFETNTYHEWVNREGADSKLAPIMPSYHTEAVTFAGRKLQSGIGLHDSSSAMIPYLAMFAEPFVLISTGTWSISMNPFNHTPLTAADLENDCLCFLTYEGKQVKASRLFAGHEHEEQVKRLGNHFLKSPSYFKSIKFDHEHVETLDKTHFAGTKNSVNAILSQSMFHERDLNRFKTYEEAYHQLIYDIVSRQVYSTNLVLEGAPVKNIFVDGGFSANDTYMHLLAASYPGIKVHSASVAQASALGAALVMNLNATREADTVDLIHVKSYSH